MEVSLCLIWLEPNRTSENDVKIWTRSELTRIVQLIKTHTQKRPGRLFFYCLSLIFLRIHQRAPLCQAVHWEFLTWKRNANFVWAFYWPFNKCMLSWACARTCTHTHAHFVYSAHTQKHAPHPNEHTLTHTAYKQTLSGRYTKEKLLTVCVCVCVCVSVRVCDCRPVSGIIHLHSR